MVYIQVDENGLLANSSALDQKISQYRELNTRLNTLLGRMESSWEGNASQAYLRTMRLYANKAEMMIHVLIAYKNYVDKARDKFEETDRQMAERLRNSF